MLEQYGTIIAEESSKLTQFYHSLDPGSVVDLSMDMKNVSLEILSRAAFSLELGLVGGGGRNVPLQGGTKVGPLSLL